MHSLSIMDGDECYSGGGCLAVGNDPAIARMGGIEFHCFTSLI